MAPRSQILSVLLIAACSTGCASQRSTVHVSAPGSPGAREHASGPCAIVSTGVVQGDWPTLWRTSQADPGVLNIPASRASHWESVACSALKKYPPGVIETNLDAVFIVQTLKLWGVGAAAYPTERSIFLAVADLETGEAASSDVQGSLHASIASALWYQHKNCMKSDRWNALLPRNFSYAGWEHAIVNPLDRSPELQEDGFYENYSTSNMEADFTVIASGLMSGSQDLWEAARAHERIRAKLELTMQFYQCIDPRFTEAFFKSLSLRHESGAPRF